MAFDPFASGLATEQPQAFDPFAAGLAEEETRAPGLADAGKALARGATTEGFYAGLEGLARLGAQGSGNQYVRGGLEWYADAVRGTRESIREALPIAPEVERHLGTQIISGLGQAAGTLPLYAVPGAGPGVTVGQLYSQGYDDAKSKGADEATAQQAALYNVPAAALDVVADRLVIGKILKPLKGKMTVGQVIKAVGVASGVEGSTEGAQQVWSNFVAQRLSGYDPNRPLDDQVINSVIVGAAVGGIATAGGQAVASRIPQPAQAPAAPRQEPAAPGTDEDFSAAAAAARQPLPLPLDPAAAPADASPVDAEIAAAFDPFASGQADPAPGPQVEPAPEPQPAAPQAPKPWAEYYTPDERLPDAQRAVQDRFAAQIAADPEGAVQAYIRDNTENGLLVIDPDQAREQSSDYNATKESRGEYAPAVHEPASALAKMVYARALAAPPVNGAVLFLAGGGGSGKGTANKIVEGDRPPGADFAVDGTFANYRNSAKRVDQALASGRKAEIRFFFRPMALAWRGVEQRRVDNGRRVPFEVFKESHDSALASVLEMEDRYRSNPNVVFTFVDNSGSRIETKLVSKPELLAKAFAADKLSAREAAQITREVENERGAKANNRETAGQALGRDNETGGGRRSGDESPTSGGRPVPITVGPERGMDGAEPQAQPGDRGEGASGPAQIVEFPIDQIAVNKDVPQFKGNADAKTGVVEPLKGKFTREPLIRQVLIWQKASGEHEIITGRHKLDLARRSGEKTIPAQILREADGWTLERVKAVDAEVNIRGGQGEVKDFGVYFRTNEEIAEEAATARGLLSRAKGQAGWALGRHATPALWDLYANDQIPEGKAVAIARGAPGHEAAQASAIRQAKAKSADELRLYAANLARQADRANQGEQLGFGGIAQDFANFEREAEAVAKVQAQQISERRQLVEAAAGAARRPEAARKMGLPVDDPAALQAKINGLREEIARFENPDEATYEALRQEAGLAPAAPAEPAAAPEDPNQAAMFARRSAAPKPDRDQADMFIGGETGGDTSFNLAPQDQKDWAGFMDEKLAARDARQKQEVDQGLLFSQRTPQAKAGFRKALAAQQARWRANAERIAPGLMQKFRLEFGDPAQLVAMGRADSRKLTGAEEAAYLAHERILFLFDQALQARGDLGTRINLLHEMAHAHWDTLPASRQEELATQWRRETGQVDGVARHGPLYAGGKMKQGVAHGVEASVREWYAERVAWVNHRWAGRRIAAGEAGDGLLGRLAQMFRQALLKAGEYVAQFTGRKLDVDFRAFLDQGDRFAERGVSELDKLAAVGESVAGEQLEQYVAAAGVRPEKQAEAARDLAVLVGLGEDSQLDLFQYSAIDGSETGLASGRRPKRAPVSNAGLAERSYRAQAALVLPDSATAVGAAFADGPRISSIVPELVRDPFAQSWDIRGAVISSAADFAQLCQMLRTPYAEITKIAFLNARQEVVHSELLTIGALSAAMLDPKMIGRVLAKLPNQGKGLAAIVSHNHPSGDPVPSSPDVSITRMLGNALAGAGVPLIDHVITNGTEFYSFRERGNITTSLGATSQRRPAAVGAQVAKKQPLGQKADWEVVARGDLPEVTPDLFARISSALRQGDVDRIHAVYTNQKQRIVGLERLTTAPNDIAATISQVFAGAGREGARSFFLVLPKSMTAQQEMACVRAVRDWAKDSGLDALDISLNHQSGTARTIGVMEGAGADFARRSGRFVSRRSIRDDARAWLVRNFTSAAGLPAEVFRAKLAKDGRLASIGRQCEFALRDFDRAAHVVYGGWGAMTQAQIQELDAVLGARAPMGSLDPRLHAPVAAMRNHIDLLSRRLVASGAIPVEIEPKINGNIGFYLNRSYRKFDDPKWAQRVPEAVRNRAESFIAAELARQPGRQGPPSPEEVRGYVEYILDKDAAGPEMFFQAPPAGKGMDLRVLTPRQNIPQELRDLMGEYHDPRVNYLRSVAKTAQILETHRMLQDVRQMGLGNWLFDRSISDATGDYSTQIAGENSPTLAPLAGLYTTPEIASAFQGTFGQADDAFRWWLRINAWAKIAKTVLSPVTQVRNLAGNVGFLVANGHWRANAARQVWQTIKTEIGRGDTPAARAYVARLTRLNVLGESVAAGEIAEALSNAGARMQGFEEWYDGRIARVIKAPFNLAARLYRMNDEIFKVYSFENERAAWAKADPTLSADQLDQVAAERVRNTLPTYSLIPKAAQAVRKYGLTGSFVSFPAEIVRTAYHTINYAVRDLRASNPRVRAMGAKRIAGLVLVAALPAAASMVSRWRANVDGEQEDDLRRFLPEWSANATLHYTANDGRGRFRLIDGSYIDPWNYLKKPITALLRGQDWQQGLIEAGVEAISPFADEGLVTKVGLDLARNADAQGRPIFNPEAPFLDRAQAQIGHAWKSFEPGIITQGRRIVKAARAEVSDTGRAYNLDDEVAAVLTGARSQSLDVGQALIFRGKRFMGQRQGAELIYREERDKQNAPAENRETARVKMEHARKALFTDMAATVQAAQRLGLSQGEALQALMAAGISEQDVGLLLVGVYLPYVDRGGFTREKAMAEIVKSR
jgi:proteasome lid subunit RPN8/RPN11